MEYVSNKSRTVLPPPGMIIPNNYVVLQERLRAEGYALEIDKMDDLITYLNNLKEASFRSLIRRLTSLAEAEREKETAFLSIIISSPIFRGNVGKRIGEIENELKKAILSDGNLGKLFNLINISKKELDMIIAKREWEIFKNKQIYEKVYDILLRKVQEALNKESKELSGVAISAVTSALSGVDVDMSLVMEEAILRVIKRDKTSLPAGELDGIVQNMLSTTGFGRSDYITKAEFQSFRKTGIINLGTLLNLKPSKRSKVKASLKSLTDSLYHGLGGEIVVDLNGGVSYGANRKHQAYKLNERKKQGLTDVIEYYDEEISLGQIQETLKNVLGVDGIENKIKSISNTLEAFSDKITIHYNIKDYRFFKDTGFAESDFKIQDGKLMTRFDKGGGVTDSDLDSLLFMVNNAADGAMYGSDSGREAVLSALASVAVKWMFDDYAEQISLPKSTTNSLHLFVINGLYYPISGILNKFIGQLEMADKGRSIILMNGTWPDADKKYVEIKATVPSIHRDYTRWNNLAAYTKQNTEIRMKLNRSFFNVFDLGGLG